MNTYVVDYYTQPHRGEPTLSLLIKAENFYDARDKMISYIKDHYIPDIDDKTFERRPITPSHEPTDYDSIAKFTTGFLHLESIWINTVPDDVEVFTISSNMECCVPC